MGIVFTLLKIILNAVNNNKADYENIKHVLNLAEKIQNILLEDLVNFRILFHSCVVGVVFLR